jgi:hypothetical protein
VKQPPTFVIYKRQGNSVVPYAAKLTKTYRAWENGKPVGLPTVRVSVIAEIPWDKLYGGHTQWISDQVDRVRDAIKAERARRAARKAPPAPLA